MIKVLLAVVICWLKIRLVCGSACIGQFFEIELKRRSKFCLQWSFLAKNLFCSACSGQYFMSEIVLKMGLKFCLQWSFVG